MEVRSDGACMQPFDQFVDCSREQQRCHNERKRQTTYLFDVVLRRRQITCLLYTLLFATLPQYVLTQMLLPPVTNCNRLFDGSDGLMSGEFGSPPPPSQGANLHTFAQARDCLLQFRAPKGKVVWLTWNSFHLEPPLQRINQCLHDYVEIIIIDYQQQQHVSKRYCGTERPPKLETMQRMVDVRFHTSSQVHYTGFTGSFQFLDESEVPPPTSLYPNSLSPELQAQCGGIAQGRFSGYPDAYPGNITCNWLIRVQRDKQIYVKLVDLQLTGDQQQCKEAAIYIIDGYKHSSLHDARQGRYSTQDKSQVHFCGDALYYSDEGAKSYMSDRNRMIIQFVTRSPPPPKVLSSRENGESIGFKIIWTEVTVNEAYSDAGEEPNECDGYLCNGGEYCIDVEGTVCARRKRYCIDRSLMCDGQNNCAENDYSDEENCYALQIVVAGLSVLLLVLIVIATVVCCQRQRNTHELRTMKQSRSANALPAPDTQDSLIANSVPYNTIVSSTPSNAQRDSIMMGSIISSNYHGGISNAPRQDESESEDDSKRPFLNHVPSSAKDDYQLARAVPAQVWECHRQPVEVHQQYADAIETSMGDDLRRKSTYSQHNSPALVTPQQMGIYRAEPAIVRSTPPPVAPKPLKKKSVGFIE